MKETWYLDPGETIELKLRFTDHTGKYMLHCHIIEHEDDGMMAQFEVSRRCQRHHRGRAPRRRRDRRRKRLLSYLTTDH